MNLTQVKCLNCGAKINVDYDTHTGVCVYCTSEYITEELLKSSNPNNNTTAQNFIKTVYGSEQLNLSELLRNSAVFLQLNEFKKAEENFNKAIDQNPSDWRGWFGIVKCKTKNFTDLDDKTHLEFLRKSITVANDKQVEIINKLYSTYLVAKYKLSNTTIISPPPKDDEISNVDYSSNTMSTSKQDEIKLDVKTSKKRKSSFLKILIVLCVIVGSIICFFGAEIVPFYAGYAYTATYKLDGNITLSKYNGSSINVSIPTKLNGKTLTTISRYAFKNNSDIKTITLSAEINYIQTEAFYYCSNLQSITILSDLPPHIGKNIFNLYNTSSFYIFVPSSSVSQYKVAWAAYKSIIYPMSKKPI